MPCLEPAFNPESVLEILRREGLRITKNRIGILKCLFEAQEPMSFKEIQASAARISGTKPDYATVFRMILLMERLHIVHKVNLQRSCSYYEIHDPKKHYDHLVCRNCGHVEVIDIPCPIGDSERIIAKKYGFRELSHSLEFFGICGKCD